MAGALVVEADGGSRGNPGPAAYGALVRDAATGAVLAEGAEHLGNATTTSRSTPAWSPACEAAQAIDPGAEVEVRMDSKLVVEQMSGRWKIKHEDMRRLALEARDVAADLSAGGGSVRSRGSRGPRTPPPTRCQRGHGWQDHLPACSTATRRRPTRTRPVRPAPARPVRPTSWPTPTRPTSAAAVAAGTSWAPSAPDLGRPTRLVLLRHGVTDFTVARSWTAAAEPTRTSTSSDAGQAAAAAGAVRALLGDGPVRVVSSSLARAVQTGSFVAAAMGVDAWRPTTTGTSRASVTGTARASACLAARYPDELAAAARRRHLRPGRWRERTATWPSACWPRSSGPCSRRDAGGRGDAPQADHGRPRPRPRHPARPDLAARHVTGVADRGRGLVRRRRHRCRSSTTPATFADPAGAPFQSVNRSREGHPL